MKKGDNEEEGTPVPTSEALAVLVSVTSKSCLLGGKNERIRGEEGGENKRSTYCSEVLRQMLVSFKVK